MSLAELNLSVRAGNCLESENIMTVRDLVTRTEDQLLEVRNFGETTLTEVRNKLRDLGLHLGMRLPGRARRRLRSAACGLAPAQQTHTVPSCDIDDEAENSAAIPAINVPCSAAWPARCSSPSATPSSTTTSPRSRAASSPRSPRPRKCGRSWKSASRSPAAAWWPKTAAGEFGTKADRGSDSWKSWRKSDRWNEVEPGHRAVRRRSSPLLAVARRQAGRERAVREVAPRFIDRPGGYTRILRLAKPRLGDAGTRAMLEFVGVRDRVVERSVRPTFEGEAKPAAT